MIITVKNALDPLFSRIKFDQHLYKKIVKHNVEFITKDVEFKNLFGSKLIGNQYVKYTVRDKENFYQDLFDIDYEDVVKAIDSITTIYATFKIAREDINLICFYIAHRFLSNPDLNDKYKELYAEEILTYFSYRTLVALCNSYFTYPISEEKAQTLIEKLSNKYLIKKVKNWNEYCHYRSAEYVDSKFKPLLISFTDDKAIPNAITDLFNRTKDTLKNIYSEFIDMNNNDNIIKSSKNVINDVTGQEVMVDKLETSASYIHKAESVIVDKNTFVRKDYIDVVTSIVTNISSSQIEETLLYLCDYSYKDKKSHDQTLTFIRNVIINTIEYLQNNKIFLHKKSDVLEIINNIVGNVLYARGTDISVNAVKEEGDELIKSIYKVNKKSISDRNIKNIRNGLYIYIVLRVIIDQ